MEQAKDKMKREIAERQKQLDQDKAINTKFKNLKSECEDQYRTLNALHSQQNTLAGQINENQNDIRKIDGSMKKQIENSKAESFQNEGGAEGTEFSLKQMSMLGTLSPPKQVS